MKSSYYLFFAALALTVASPVAARLNTASTITEVQSPATVTAPETRFDPAIEDLPLMDGLTPVPDQATLFTEQHRRIAESVAEGAVSVDDVYRFYHRTLPQLGWKILSAHSYHRNGEKLSVIARSNGQVTKVHFSVKPE